VCAGEEMGEDRRGMCTTVCVCDTQTQVARGHVHAGETECVCVRVHAYVREKEGGRRYFLREEVMERGRTGEDREQSLGGEATGACWETC